MSEKSGGFLLLPTVPKNIPFTILNYYIQYMANGLQPVITTRNEDRQEKLRVKIIKLIFLLHSSIFVDILNTFIIYKVFFAVNDRLPDANL